MKKSPVGADRRVVRPDWICKNFDVNPRWIERHIECGDLKPLKAGRLNRFYLDEVVAYFEREREVAS